MWYRSLPHTTYIHLQGRGISLQNLSERTTALNFCSVFFLSFTHHNIQNMFRSLPPKRLKIFSLFSCVSHTYKHTHRIIRAQSSPGPWVKSQGSKVITPAQTSASAQIMRGVKVQHALLLGSWGGEPPNHRRAHVCVYALVCVCRRDLNHVLVE